MTKEAVHGDEPIGPAERPLAQVDAAVEQIHSSAAGVRSDDPVYAARQAAAQAVRRATEDTRWLTVLMGTGFVVVTVVILAAIAVRVRPKPRTAEDLLIERSREALDQSRKALEAAIARLVSAIDR
jgi:hypothetical protein